MATNPVETTPVVTTTKTVTTVSDVPVQINKPWYKSTLLWFLVVTTIGQIVEYFIANHLFTTYAPLQIMLQGIIAIILRVWFTDSKITK